MASRRLLASIAGAALLWLVAPGQTQIIPDLVTYPFWVHPDRGSDANPGTQADPFRTLTFALAEAAALRDQLEQTPPPPPPPPPQVPLNPQWIIRIHVQSSATPMAPLGYGGHEPEFPIRLERRIEVLGVNSPTHGKARIVIDDQNTPTFYPWPSIPPTHFSGRRAFVYAAQNCTLKNFRIDGTLMRNKYEPYTFGGEPQKKSVVGLLTTDKTDFHIEDCDLLGQYDGASWFATAGGTASGTVTGCSFQGFFPFPDLGPTPGESEGHGGLWLEGQNGLTTDTQVSVQVFNSTFLGSHDGIEIAGPKVTHPEIPRFRATLTVDGCVFDGNENGIEVVGKGRLDVTVTASLFRRNIPRWNDGGTSADIVTAGLAARGMEILARVRESVFVNNAAAVVWNLDDPDLFLSCLDLGHAAGETETVCFGASVPTAASPGLNVFDIDYTDWDPTRDAYTVLILSRTNSTAIPVHAAGNTWLPLVQGADASGCLSGEFTGPFNFPPPHWSIQSLANRNFSIQQTGARIRFDPSCP